MLFPRERYCGNIYSLQKIGGGTSFCISFKACNGFVAMVVYMLLALKYNDPYIVSFTGSPNHIKEEVLNYSKYVVDNYVDKNDLLTTCIDCFFNTSSEELFEYIKNNCAYIIDALNSACSGDFHHYVMHETYRIDISKICYENNTDAYCYNKLNEIDRDIIMCEKNEFCKNILYTCRELAHSLSITANALNWNSNRVGGEVEIEPKKWFEWILVNIYMV